MLLEPVQLTPTGRHVLHGAEYELYTLEKVDLEFDGSGGLQGHMDSAYKGGYVVLTSSRLIWMSSTPEQRERCCSLPLASLLTWTRKSQLALTGMKIRVVLLCAADAQARVVAAMDGMQQTVLTLRIRGDPPESLLMHLDTVVPAAKAAAAQARSRIPTAERPTGAEQPASGRVQPAAPAQAGPPLQATHSQPGAAARVAYGSQPIPLINMSMLQQMVDMGFPRWSSARALLQTQSASVQTAVDHLLEGEGVLSDEPFDLYAPQAQPSASLQPTPQGGYAAPQQQPSQHLPPLPPQGPATAATFMPSMGPLTAGLQAMHTRQSSQAGPRYGGQAGEEASSWSGSQHMSYDAGSEWGSAAGSQGGAVTGTSTGGQQRSSYQGAAGNYSNPLLSAAEPIHSHAVSISMSSYDSGAWQPVPSGADSGARPAGSSLSVGVSGLVRREMARNQEAGKALDTAFQDLHALMSMAADMVALAERFRTVSSAKGTEVGAAGEDVLDADTAAQLVALGIASPVTRATAGSRYQVELSRQLCDWLLGQGGQQGPLTHAGGLMPLTDVYCLFNRARGIELVSPDDLLAAAKLFPEVGAPVTLRPLSSGMLAVQSPEFSAERVCARIAGLVDPAKADSTPSSLQGFIPGLGAAVTASDVAALLNCSISLAAEHLAMAESRGVVCRDEGAEGLRFFHNFFKDESLLVLAQ